MRPVIGITASYDDEKHASTLPHTYVDSILEAGGNPVLIPIVSREVADETLSMIDGILFPGGVDVDPRLYDERPSVHLGRINPLLDELEIYVARRALKMDLPILGICRGCQVVTVAAGGTLVQDIPTQVGGAQKHFQNAPRWYGTHEVILEENSLVSRLFGTRRLVVNSFHHQAIKNPGDGFTVTGRALDGVAEAAEARKGFKLLLQWHPEAMWKNERLFLEPFKALVEAANERNKGRR